MTKKTMELLCRMGQESDIVCRPYPDYSGRCMYGKTTCGVVVDNPLDIGVLVGLALMELLPDRPNAAEKTVCDCRNLRMDGMGRDQTIIY